ncbi:hypothetical protein BEWA_023180 [Theileria equi strain WA]|uniref:Signal peptide containing protein n=1 Tax=Theileria equi strain WA TaxID=1537102 RepID=L0AX59_THEEQ|nr:hypothetical protein BEWA_023180 [Theileria equi strain WA]AFZ79469.1 hypothetical protein BEWA_023180 [Theileria equi strain WA]|eukprot:XP_004829135.1 hypothetical protein BEWA_023180 [Theileria equi strain WA]
MYIAVLFCIYTCRFVTCGEIVTLDLSSPSPSLFTVTDHLLYGVNHRAFVPKDGCSLVSVVDNRDTLWTATDTQEGCTGAYLFSREGYPSLLSVYTRGAGDETFCFEKDAGAWKNVSKLKFETKLRSMKDLSAPAGEEHREEEFVVEKIEDSPKEPPAEPQDDEDWLEGLETLPEDTVIDTPIEDEQVGEEDVQPVNVPEKLSKDNLRASQEHAKVFSEETPVEVTPDSALQEEMHVDEHVAAPSGESTSNIPKEEVSSQVPTTSEDKFNVKYFEKANRSWKEATLKDFLNKSYEMRNSTSQSPSEDSPNPPWKLITPRPSESQ